MSRVKRGTTSVKRRKNVLAKTKGFRHGRKSKETMARTAIRKAGQHSFQDRRKKKGVFRSTWIIRMNAALVAEGESYNKFIRKLLDHKILLNRKMLSQMARDHNATFRKIVELVK
jgi:large subunit ribosomal protein L20